MDHKPSYPEDVCLLGRRCFGTTNYSPIRRYYRARNVLWVLRTYGRSYLTFCLALLYGNGKDVLKVVAEKNSLQKYRSALRGYWHGLLKDPERVQ